MPRQRAPIIFGPGLDRASGAMSQNPSSFADVRDFYARDDKIALRPGLSGTTFPAVGFGTDIVGIFALKATKDVLLAVYDRATSVVKIYRLNPVATPTTQLVGTWGTLAGGAQLPKVIAAESYGMLFLAHDEETFANRLATVYYTPNAVDANVGTLTTLTADLNGDGASANVLFRGVVAYNNSLWGWGYGDETNTASQDRGEIVRNSVPGDPLTYKPEGYFIAGARADAVITCLPLGNILVVRKANEGHRIIGADPTTYGIDPADALFGCEAARLGIVIGGSDIPRLGMVMGTNAYVWGTTGCRRITPDGGSVDVAIPLELDGPSPATLAAQGLTRNGFAVWENDTRLLRFVFPDIVNATAPTLEFILSLRDPEKPRWSYGQIRQAVYCAGPMITGKATPAAITGYASAVSATDAGIATDNAHRLVTVAWTNNSQQGNESVQIFRRVAGTGSYAVVLTVPVSNGASQSVQLTDADPVESYDYAIRYIRSGVTTSGYESSDPTAWTAPTAAGAKVTASTTAQQPVMSTALWSRVSAVATQIALTWTLADTTAPQELQKSPDNVTFSPVTTFTSGERSGVYTPTGGELGTTLYFRVVPKRSSPAVSGPAATSISRYAGVLTPILRGQYCTNDGTGKALPWVVVESPEGDTVYVYDSGVGAQVGSASVAACRINQIALSGPTANPGTSVSINQRARASWTAYGVTDYSAWTGYTAGNIGTGDGGFAGNIAMSSPSGTFPGYTAGDQAQFTVNGYGGTPTGNYLVMFTWNAGQNAVWGGLLTNASGTGLKSFQLPASARGQNVTWKIMPTDALNYATAGDFTNYAGNAPP